MPHRNNISSMNTNYNMNNSNMINSTDIPSSDYPPTSPQALDSNTLKNTTLRIGTLNCRALVKTHNRTTRNNVISFLHLQQHDILALQKTHASTLEEQAVLNKLFRTEQTIWSSHCGIVCLNPSLEMHPYFITRDQRVTY